MSLLILAEDYLDDATRTVSSENSDFPASNLYDQKARSLTWRSAGYWEITSTNKTIIFRETADTDLTATIAEANYTSTATFLAAVKAAIETAGASTYTVAQDTTTKKIKITSDGSGGGGIFELMVSDDDFTAADLMGFDDSDDLTGALTYTADQIRIHTSEWLKWDLGATSNPDVLVAIGKRSTGVNLTSSATITLQGSTTDDWTSPEYSQVITFDSRALIDLKTSTDEGLHTSALRYFRMKIINRDNPNGYVELSNIYLGEYYTPTTGKPQFPFKQSLADYSKVSRSDTGAAYATRNERADQYSVGWRFLTTTEKEALDEIYADVGTSKPFFVIMDSDTHFSSDIEYFTAYVRFDGGISTTLDRAGQWSTSWSMSEEV